MNFIPTNAVDALRLARTTEKAKAIIADGYDFELDAELNIVYVCKPGSGAFAYIINLDPADTDPEMVLKFGCNCPDFQHHGNYCKHLLAYRMIQEEQEEEKAQIARYEEQEYGRAVMEEANLRALYGAANI